MTDTLNNVYKMAMIYAISNHKGGVGKTTTAVNVSARMAMLGKRVLLIDCDPQANATQYLGQECQQPNIYQNLVGGIPFQPVEVMPELHLIPSDIDLAGAEMELHSAMRREYILHDLIEPMRNRYDFILIDTPPSLGLLTINALTAADAVLIPMETHYLAMKGVGKLLDVVGLVRQKLNKGLKVGGVILTRYDGRLSIHQAVVKKIHDEFGEKTLKNTIRSTAALAEAPPAMQDVFRYAPKSKGADDYAALTDEILSIN